MGTTSPVTRKHPAYDRNAFAWRRCRDCYQGSDAIKAGAELYLPMLSANQGEGYPGYLFRAEFMPAFGRTVESLLGAVYRKPPQLANADTPLEEQMKNIDRDGCSLNAFAMKVLRESLVTGRSLILVDAKDGTPFWRCYQAEDILSWYAVDGQLLRVVVRECFEKEREDDKYNIGEYWRVREVALEEGNVVVRQYVADAPRNMQFSGLVTQTGGFFNRYPGAAAIPEDVGKVELAAEHTLSPTPMRNGEPFIPAFFAGADDNTARVGIPPFLGLADVNLSHYRTAADLEHALHWVALPTPWVSGKGKIPDGLAIGSSAVWDLPPESTAGMLEVSGQGFDALAGRLSKKEDEMAALGARMVAEPMRQPETAEAVRIKTSGDRAALMNILTNVENAVTAAVQFHARWAGIPGEDPTFTYNRDIVDRALSYRDIQTLFALLQAGKISQRSFYEALQGGHVDPGRTFEQEQEAIDDDGPPAGPAPTMPPVAPPAGE